MYVRIMTYDAIATHELTTDAIAHAIDTLDAIENAIRVKRLEWVVEYDERQAWKEDGVCSMVDWLCFRRGCSRSTAREDVRVAHALRDLPYVKNAAVEGRLSWDKVVLITRVADADSDNAWAREAEGISVAELESWVRQHRRIRREDAERQLRERFVRMSWNDDDATLRLNGRLVGAEAAALKHAIEQRADEIPKQADGTYAPYEWRCADALAELASAHLSELDSATVVVHIDHDRLNHINGAGLFEDGPSVIAETARRLACDGKVQLSVDDANGGPLKLGRTKRTVSLWQRRQIHKRDRSCRFPGCARTRGIQVHHIHHWAHGGATDDDNLLCLCWYHHRLVHEGGWKIRKEARDHLRFIRPDGRPLTDRATPLDPRAWEQMFGQAARE